MSHLCTTLSFVTKADRVMLDLSLINRPGAYLFVDQEQTGKHVDCTLPIKRLSVMSRPAATNWDSSQEQMGPLHLFFKTQTFTSCCLTDECEVWQQRMLRTDHFSTLESFWCWEKQGCTQQTSTYCCTRTYQNHIIQGIYLPFIYLFIFLNILYI